MVEVGEGFFLPESVLEFFARNEVALAPDQEGLDFERLAAELDSHARLAQLAGAGVELEGNEPVDHRWARL